MKNITKLITMITVPRPSILFFSFLFITFSSSAQMDPEKNAIILTIDKFFDGFTKSDTTLIKPLIDKNMTLQTVYEKNNVVQIQNEPISDFLKTIAKPKKQK